MPYAFQGLNCVRERDGSSEVGWTRHIARSTLHLDSHLAGRRNSCDATATCRGPHRMYQSENHPLGRRNSQGAKTVVAYLNAPPHIRRTEGTSRDSCSIQVKLMMAYSGSGGTGPFILNVTTILWSALPPVCPETVCTFSTKAKETCMAPATHAHTHTKQENFPFFPSCLCKTNLLVSTYPLPLHYLHRDTLTVDYMQEQWGLPEFFGLLGCHVA
jgi:hypothetical protein